jgi:hypothetical protein
VDLTEEVIEAWGKLKSEDGGEMGGTCSMHGTDGKHRHKPFQLENLREEATWQM